MFGSEPELFSFYYEVRTSDVNQVVWGLRSSFVSSEDNESICSASLALCISSHRDLYLLLGVYEFFGLHDLESQVRGFLHLDYSSLQTSGDCRLHFILSPHVLEARNAESAVYVYIWVSHGFP